VIGGLALFLIFVIAIVGMISISLSGSTKPLERLALELISTKDITSKAKDKIKSTKLLAINSSLDINLTNIIRDITPLLTNEKIDIKKINSKAVAAENTEILARLEDARLNVKYDVTYAGEMATLLKDIIILMNQINKTTHNKDLKNVFEESITNIEPIKNQLADFNTISS
jgi:hypothetical protein